MRISSFFSDCYLIRLMGNETRRGNALTQLRGAELFPRFKWAIIPDDPGTFKTRGMRGCTESHLAVVKEAKERKLESALIAEDDVLLWPDFMEKWEVAEKALRMHISEWDLFYFYSVQSAELTDAGIEGPLVIKTNGEVNGHLYAVHSRFYDRYIVAVEEGMKQGKMQDETLYELPDKIVYAIHPPMAGQAAGYSNVIEQDRPERFMPVELPNDELTKLSDQFPVED